MEAILHTFGIDTELIVIQIFNFALLAGALWYFLYTPVLNIIKERQQKVEQGVKDADAARQQLNAADAERKEILTTAHQEAEAITARANEHAKERQSEIVSAAEQKASGIVDDAQKKSEDLKAQALRESEAEVAKLAVLAAEKVLREKQS